MAKCETCKKHEDCRNGSGLTWPCGAYRPTVITNADRIRSMSDEEMAQFIYDVERRRICRKPMPLDSQIGDAALYWLQQPAEEG